MVESGEDEGKAFKEELRKIYERNAPPKNRRGRPAKKVRSSLDPEEYFDDISPPSDIDESEYEKSNEIKPPTSWEDWETMSSTTSLGDSSYVTSPEPDTPPGTPETEYTTESSLSHYNSSETDPAMKTEEDPNETPVTPTSPSSEPSEASEFKSDSDDFISDFAHDPENPYEVPFAKGAWPRQWGPRNALRNKVIEPNLKPAVEYATGVQDELTYDDYKELILNTAPYFGTAVMKNAFAKYSTV